jgi:tRNA1(Val) A37 N6-methylase TrmN6
MNEDKILEKYGNASYVVDQDTFHMGIHHLISDHIAKRFEKFDVVLDACAGAGFMAIVIAKHVTKVIAVDVDKNHLSQAKINAEIDLLNNKITFIEGDVLEKLKEISKFDAAFLDPDWARPGEDKAIHVHELSDMVPSGQILFDEVFKTTNNICLRLPKEFDTLKLKSFPPHEVQSVYQDNKLKFFCVYFGGLINEVGETEFKV